MLRKITKDVGRFHVGNQLDYPLGVWTQIERDAKMPLDKFSVRIESNAVLQSSLKGRPQIHTRLGATA